MWLPHSLVNFYHLKHRKGLATEFLNVLFFFCPIATYYIWAKQTIWVMILIWKTHGFINTLIQFYEKQLSIIYYIKLENLPSDIFWVELWRYVVSIVDAATISTCGTYLLSSVLISVQVATPQSSGLLLHGIKICKKIPLSFCPAACPINCSEKVFHRSKVTYFQTPK